MNHQFYVVLPSNGSMTLYPNNTCSKFKINLSSTLELNPEQWEVGLAEIQFPGAFENIRKDKNRIAYLSGDTWVGYKVPRGFYENPKDLVEKLREIEHLHGITFTYKETKKRTEISVPANCGIDFMDSDVGRYLGFDANTIITDKNMLSPYETSPFNGIHTLFVYSDIVGNQYVGDVKAPLLRSVPIKRNKKGYHCVVYDRPHFLSINRGLIQSIEIDIRDDTGEFMSFAAGRVIVTLVFNRRTAKFYD